MEKPTNHELLGQLAELRKRGLSEKEINGELSTLYGKSARQIRRWKADLPKQTIPPSTRPKWDKTLRLYGDSIALWADAHHDFHDRDFMLQALDFQVSLDCQSAIILGDWLDLEVLSPFIPEAGGTLRQEFEAARESANALVSICKSVVAVPGNHEDRILKKLGRGIGMRELLDLIGVHPDVQGSDYSQVVWNDEWLLCHPNEYSRVKGAKARGLAAKYGRNIAMAHQHRYFRGFSDTSDEFHPGHNYHILELGMLADPDRLAYTRKKLTTSPPFEQSFTVITKGKNETYEIHTLLKGKA